jgi:hypothetical protein
MKTEEKERLKRNTEATKVQHSLNGVIILSIVALVIGSCKNQPENSNARIPVSDKHLDSVEIQFINNKLNELETDTKNWVKFKSKYNFSAFNTEIFKGKLTPLDFTESELSTDKQANEFMSNQMKDYIDFWTENDPGINFGGHYTIIHKSCGLMCEYIYVIDRISGEIYTDINLTTPDNGNGKWGYLYKSDSKMLIANSALFTTDSLNCYTAVYGITPEFYVWTGKYFKRIQ